MAAAVVGDNGGMGQRQMTFEGNKTDRSQMITLEIDLTDPKDLLEKMELIDLTEEETDELLEQALAINKQLKMELEKREKVEQSSRSFMVSAPALCPQQRVASGRYLQPSDMPRTAYRPQDVMQNHSLARLRNSNSLDVEHSRAADPFKSNSYSYHSARPRRSMPGSYGNNSDQLERMNDY